MDSTEIQNRLDAFLVANYELEELAARLSAFNLFNVLRADKVEIRHSNVLGWLLDPSGSHGLGSVFLRRFLSGVLIDQDVSDVSLTASEVELMDFNNIEVRREWQHIDVLVICREKKWCILVELSLIHI